jgi:hypothetical protein
MVSNVPSDLVCPHPGCQKKVVCGQWGACAKGKGNKGEEASAKTHQGVNMRLYRRLTAAGDVAGRAIMDRWLAYSCEDVYKDLEPSVDEIDDLTIDVQELIKAMLADEKAEEEEARIKAKKAEAAFDKNKRPASTVVPDDEFAQRDKRLQARKVARAAGPSGS